MSNSSHTTAALKIENLKIHAGSKLLLELDHFTCFKGSIHAVIGESGSGKSLLLKSLMGLLKSNLSVSGKAILPESSWCRDLLDVKSTSWNAFRGKYLGMVFQEPMSALNPQMTCGEQLQESWDIHCSPNNKGSKSEIYNKLDAIGLGSIADRVYRSYPHELSGGQRQRVMIAMATLHNPEFILADEPTTALDYFSRKQVIRDFTHLAKSLGSTVIWVSHELDLVNEFAEYITVLRKGKFVQYGSTQQVLNQKPEPYVKELLDAVPQTKHEKRPLSQVKISIQELNKIYGQKGNSIHALQDFSVELSAGQTLAVIGTSGSGKSTLAKLLVGLERPESGKITINGKDIPQKTPTGVQMVFQDPYSSLNRRHTSMESILEILKLTGQGDNELHRRELAERLLYDVGFDESLIHKKPDQMSGGQRQRLCIAKALSTRPEILILDEAVAALDPLIQKQILDLLVDLQKQKGLIYIFITHNLDVAKYMADVWCYLENGKTMPVPSLLD